MKIQSLFLLLLLLIIQSCSFRNPFILDTPYYYKAIAIINDEECSLINEYESSRDFFSQRSISNQAAPQFFSKTIKGKDIVAFCFQPYHGLPFQKYGYVFPCYWICSDFVIEDSKRYYYNDEFKQLFDADDDKRWLAVYVDKPRLDDYDPHPVIGRPIAGGEILSGWMSFTKHVDHRYLAYTVYFEFDMLNYDGDKIMIRNGRLDIAKKFLDIDQSFDLLWDREYGAPIR